MVLEFHQLGEIPVSDWFKVEPYFQPKGKAPDFSQMGTFRCTHISWFMLGTTGCSKFIVQLLTFINTRYTTPLTHVFANVNFTFKWLRHKRNAITTT